MPTTTISKCRPLVQERTAFNASMLQAKWERAEDGTKLYVVRSICRKHGYIRDEVILFVYHDGEWYDADNIPFRCRRRRLGHKSACLPCNSVTRIQAWELRAFVREGMAHHPKMQRLLDVSV